MGAAAGLPGGTVTFLFTDVEGRTRLLEAPPDAHRAAVKRHRALLTEAVAAHLGLLIVTCSLLWYRRGVRNRDGQVGPTHKSPARIGHQTGAGRRRLVTATMRGCPSRVPIWAAVS
jgi:hypothetical protein